jgi:hypothetical protein
MSNKKDKPGLFIGVYGPAKTGKTWAAISLAAGDGYFIGSPNALIAAETVFGEDLSKRIFLCRLASDVVNALKKISSMKKLPKTIVIDDFSLIMDRTIDSLEDEKSSNKAKFWRGVKDAAFDVSRWSRYLNARGVNVVINFHEQPPRVSSGRPVRGGPRLIGQLPEQMCAELDIILKVEYDVTCKPWPYIARTISRDYIAGDRLSVFVDGAPFNLSEGLRRAGYDVPYCAAVILSLGLSKLKTKPDAIVERISKLNPEDLRIEFERLKQENISDVACMLLFQDGMHRKALRSGWCNQMLDSLFEPEKSGEDEW